MKKSRLILMVAIMMIVMASFAYAEETSLEATAQATKFLEDMSGKLVAMSTFAAGIAVAIGAFMAKFSMGDEQKIKLGKNLIKNAIILWTIVNSLTLILNTIKPYLGK